MSTPKLAFAILFLGGAGGACSAAQSVGQAGQMGAAGAAAGGQAVAGASGSAGTSGSDGGGNVGSGGEGGAAPDPMVTPEAIRIRGGDPNMIYFDLQVRGEGLGSLEGRLVTVRVGDPPLARQRLGSAQTHVVDGRFSLDLPQSLEDGLYKHKIIHFDVDGDERCGPADRVAVDNSSSASASGVAIRTFGPDALDALPAPSADVCTQLELCGSLAPPAEPRRPILDMKVTGSGFDAHEGRSIQLVSRIVGAASIMGVGRARILGGGFTMWLPNGYRRHERQEFLWFVDVDGDRACSPFTTDHLGYATADAFDPPGNAAVDVTVTDDHLRTLPANVSLDVCAAAAPFVTLEVFASGFEAPDRTLAYLLTRTPNGAPLGGAFAALSAGGVAFPKLGNGYERRSPQELLWFVDVARTSVVACDRAAGNRVGAKILAATDVFSSIRNADFTDQVVATTNSGEDICALMNGCL